MPPCPDFVSLSVGQVIAIVAFTVAAIALGFVLGHDEGRERTTRKLKKQARENGVDWRWLEAPAFEDEAQ